MLPCLNKTLLGVECTGCGAQRAVVLLFQGEFPESISYVSRYFWYCGIAAIPAFQSFL